MVQGDLRWQLAAFRIRMEAYDHSVLDLSASEIVDTAKRTGRVSMDRFSSDENRAVTPLLRSPHIDKKSRESFEIRNHKRVIDIVQPTARPSTL